MVGAPFEGKVETMQRSIDTVSFWLKSVGFFDRTPCAGRAFPGQRALPQSGRRVGGIS